MRQKENYTVIGRGKAGWHAQLKNISSSGGSLEKYISEAIENCLVYDADLVDYDMFWNAVVKGPMVDLSLSQNTVDKFVENVKREPLSNENYGSFDKVSLDIFERLLRQLPGMRIGRVTHGQVTWE
jgi:hypothetical protein